MTSTLPPVPELGKRIRDARKARNLTLEALSTRAGVSRSLLSQIERGLVNPTFAVAWNLCQSLGLDLNRIGTDATAEEAVQIEHLHAYATPVKSSADGKVSLRLLSPVRTVLPVEWYEMRLEPDGALTSQPHERGTFEHLTCLDGALSVTVAERMIPLAAGETLRYDADRPHEIANAGTAPARALLVVALPAQYAAPPNGA